ncbi:MAG: ATP-dependent Clp protease ATP-binding subunit [Patescibacteria group bacterium]
MINPAQISFPRNEHVISTSRLGSLFNRHGITLTLDIFASLGLVSAVILIVGYFFIDLGLILSIVPKIVLFVGLKSFVFSLFIKMYFKEEEENISIPESAAGYNAFGICDFETVKILALVNLESPDILDFYGKLLGTRRVSFIASEMGMNDEFNQRMVSGLPKDKNLLPQIFAYALENAINEKSRFITTADVFYGFIKCSATLEQALMSVEINEDDLFNIVFWANNLFEKVLYPKTLLEKMHSKNAGLAEGWTSGYTLFLDRFSTDVTNPSYFGSFSAQGREQILTHMENTLSKEAKNNCILVGDTGSGKTSLVYGFAEKIYWGDTLPELSHKRIVALDTSVLLSGVQDVSEVHERLLGVLNDAVRAGNVILFIDNIHDLFAGGGDKVGTVDASEIIAPYLQNSSLRIIGISDNAHYQTYIVPHTQIAGNMERIEVPPTDENQTIRILEDLSLYFSSKFGIRITYNALKEVYKLAERFVGDKGFPARAVDMLENVCTSAKNSDTKILDRHVTDKLAESTLNVPIQEAEGSERETLLNLEEKLHSRVIGQEEAVKAVSQALQRARTQVTDTKRPIGTFLFMGPTGVGKTELSKALAWAYFGNEENMVRMDMNEFQEASAVDRFIGRQTPGSEVLEGGDFVKKVREKPFSVVLLDELEKAHPDILNLFLQILDEGYFTDGMGNKVSFQNSIIIATSNAGANLIREGVTSGKTSENLKTELLNYLQSQGIYKPEFLNRFDGAIVFKPLTKEELLKIAGLMFENTCAGLKQKGYVIQIEQPALEKLVEWGYQPEFGARPMRRVFQDRLESMLAKKILEGTVQKGAPFMVKLSDIEDTAPAVGNV